jgi:hypothetical protein
MGWAHCLSCVFLCSQYNPLSVPSIRLEHYAISGQTVDIVLCILLTFLGSFRKFIALKEMILEILASPFKVE